MKQLKEINRLQSELKKSRPLNQTEMKRLRNEFIVESTYDSNAIEGSTLTLNETYLILEEGITIAKKPVKEHLEAIGYRDAFNFVYDLASDQTNISERDIKQIHSLVLMNDPQNKGRYRQIPVQTLGAVHQTARPEEIESKMQHLLDNYQVWKKEKHILEAVALFHLEFEAIHPFIDGNGRTGRLILNLELIKIGLLPINIKYENREQYYSCFDDYHLNNTPNELVTLLAKYEFKKYLEIIQTKNNLDKDEPDLDI